MISDKSAQSSHRNRYSEENEKTTENYSQSTEKKTSGEEICVRPHDCHELRPKQSCFRLFQSAVKIQRTVSPARCRRGKEKKKK